MDSIQQISSFPYMNFQEKLSFLSCFPDLIPEITMKMDTYELVTPLKYKSKLTKSKRFVAGACLRYAVKVKELCSQAERFQDSRKVNFILNNAFSIYCSLFYLKRILDHEGYLDRKTKDIIENISNLNEPLNVAFEFIDTFVFNREDETADPKFEFEFKIYSAIATTLSRGELQNPTLRHILNLISSIFLTRNRRPNLTGSIADFPASFISVVGPSLSGKTQLAHTLSIFMPVIYLNFDSRSEQPAYRKFAFISTLILNTAIDDLRSVKKYLKKHCNITIDAANSVGAHDLLIFCSNMQLKTLGIILVILEHIDKYYRIPEENRCSWMSHYLTLGSFVYSSISIRDFEMRFSTLLRNNQNMKEPIAFLDEFSKVNEMIFLRNLFRAIYFPCVMASTNAKVSNMLTVNRSRSRGYMRDWCNIVTRLPSSQTSVILEILQVPDYSEFSGIPRDEAIGPLALSAFISLTHVDIPALIDHLRIPADQTLIGKIEKIVKLLLQQSRTCLPGLTFIAFHCLVFILTKASVEKPEHMFDIWEMLISEISKYLLIRKSSIAEMKNLYYSHDTFSLHSEFSDTHSGEGPASESIHGHLFYFGRRSNYNQAGILSISCCSSVLYENDQIFIHKSYFSSFAEDVIIHLSIWQITHTANLIQLDNGTEHQWKPTVARLLYDFRKNSNRVASNPIQPIGDFNAQEQLAILCLAHSSHYNLRGETDALELTSRFGVHVQLISQTSSRVATFDNLIPDNIYPIPLFDFLKSYKIPYLIPGEIDVEVGRNLNGLINTGIAARLRNATGFDISFNISDSEAVGFIECKNLQTTVTTGSIKPYILKAMNHMAPITYFLCKSAGESLLSANNFKFSKFFEDRANRVKFKVNYSYEQMLSEARIKRELFSEFKLNIYALIHSQTPTETDFKMEFATLYEVPSGNPDGVFIIIESNCTLLI